jgi:regulator of sirC expression with transglutaminase-like and TPR domain
LARARRARRAGAAAATPARRAEQVERNGCSLVRVTQPAPSSPRQRFASAIAQPERELDLALAALWIAAEAYPALDVDHYMRALDAFADAVRTCVRHCATERDAACAIVRHLRVEERFAGNRAVYYDPRNSMLNEVIDRRLGIPITLSIVLIEVARRLGVTLLGVGFPGHFLVRTPGDPPLLLDAFEGRSIEPHECEALLRRARGDDAVLLPQHLRGARPSAILARILGNLKHIYLESEDFHAALACCDRILMLQPDSVLELRDRGLIYARLECFRAALSDIERYIALADDARVERAAHDVRAMLRRRVQQLH